MTCRDCGQPRPKFKTYCEACRLAHGRRSQGCQICGGEKPKGQGVKRCPDCAGVPGPWRRCEDCDKLRSVGIKQIAPNGTVCADCLKARKREYAQRYYAEHRDEVTARMRANRAKDRDGYNERRRAYYAENKDRYLAAQAAYRARPEVKEAARQRSAEWYRAHTELSIERSAEWYRNNREAVRRHHDAAEERTRRDPVRAAARRESQRLSRRLRAEQNGRPMKPMSEAAYVKRYGDGKSKAGSLPIAPILDLLEGFDTVTAGRMCDELGIHRHRLLVVGERISVVTADRICVYLGVPMSLVYQEAA